MCQGGGFGAFKMALNRGKITRVLERKSLEEREDRFEEGELVCWFFRFLRNVGEQRRMARRNKTL